MAISRSKSWHDLVLAHVKFGLVWLEYVRMGKVRFGQVRLELVPFGLVWFYLVWVTLVRLG